MLKRTVTAEKVALKFNGESFSFIYVLKKRLFLYFISFVPYLLSFLLCWTNELTYILSLRWQVLEHTVATSVTTWKLRDTL